MKVKVKSLFYDKFNLTRCFKPGEVVDFEEKRAKDIVERGLGEFFKEPRVETATKMPAVEPEAKAEAEPVSEIAPVTEEPVEKKKPGRKKKEE